LLGEIGMSYRRVRRREQATRYAVIYKKAKHSTTNLGIKLERRRPSSTW